METAKFIIELATAIGICAAAAAAWWQLPLISKQVSSLAEQIRLTREADVNADRRVQMWETLKACERYNFDPVIEAAAQRVWRASERGQNYHNLAVETRDIVVILNYLDGIAIGVEQGLYIEALVKDHISEVFDHAVVKYIDSGVIDRSSIPAMLGLHARWFRGGQQVGFQVPHSTPRQS